MLPLGKVPPDTLGRFKWVLLGFAALNFAGFAVMAAVGPAQPVAKVGTVFALAAAGFLLAHAFQRRGPSVVHDVLVVALLGVAAQGFSKVTLVQSLVFAWLTWSQLYGGYLRSVFRVLLVEAMWFTVMYLDHGTSKLSGEAGQLIGVTMASIFSFALGTALAKVQASEARFRALLQHGSDLIVVQNAAGVVAYASPAAERAFAVKAGDRAAALGPTFALRGRHELKLSLGGGPRDCELVVTDLLRDPDVQGLVMNVRDISDRKALATTQAEVAIAARIQTSLLPAARAYAGFEISAAMLPAADVGGDYYDIFEVDDGIIVGIGDVSGHGLPAGLIMLMTQSVVAALVRSNPRARPRELVLHLNRVLHDNIRGRLGQREHVTFSLLKIGHDGRVFHAGAHEELYVLRAKTGTVETVPTHGVWLGALPDISETTVQSELKLEPGDVLLLHTDGVTEARDSGKQEYGHERLIAHLQRSTATATDALCKELMADVERFAPERADDRSLVVVRYVGKETEISSGAKLASA